MLRSALSSTNVRYELDAYCLLRPPTEDGDTVFICKVPTRLYQARQHYIPEHTRLIFIVHKLHPKHKMSTVTPVRTLIKVSHNKLCMLKANKIQKQGKWRIRIIKPFEGSITNETSKRTSKWKQKELKNAVVEAAMESACTKWMNVVQTATDIYLEYVGQWGYFKSMSASMN